MPDDDATTFHALGLSEALLKSLEALGYEEPTPVQRRAIPLLLAGRDVLGSAATGTGKTAAFALPLVERIDPALHQVQALVMAPTRELAVQVAEAIHRYGRHAGVTVLPVYGGQPIQRQLTLLRRGVQVVVGTPGRLLDHLGRGSLVLDRVRYVVLDEADEMLDMGFADDIEAILGATPPARQTALFSATFPRHLTDLAGRHLRDPERVAVAAEVHAVPRVRQVAYVVPRARKIEALGRILDLEAPASAIVFCRTRTEVDELAEAMASRGYAPEALHGGFAQPQRDRVMARFRDGTADLLVATDVAARGLDIEHVSHVVNYDIPQSPEVYVHRIGRTGRAGREGTAITLVQPREHGLLKAIEKAVRQRIEPGRIPTLADVRARRIATLTSALRDTLVEDAFDAYRVAVQALADDYDTLDIAAAAVKLAAEAAHGDRGDEGPDVIESGPVREPRDMPGAPRKGRHRDERMARVFIHLGPRHGVRPKDIVGAIANEASLPGTAIGAIEIGETHALVEVPDEAADDVVRALARSTLRGRRARARRAK